MTALEQDFTVYSGNTAQPVFTVVDGNGNPISLAGVDDISWSVQRDLQSPVVVTKTLGTSGIMLLDGGTGGQFEVIIEPSDGIALTGYYFHQAVITDSAANVATVATGRWRVGPAPLWTYSGDPATSTKDSVRYLVGDVIEKDRQANDSEILFAIAQTGSIYAAAAMVARALATKLSREADTVDKDLRTVMSQRAKGYKSMAQDYEIKAAIRGSGLPYAGGISRSDKERERVSADRVKPQYNLGMEDNFIPVGPAGNEQPDNAR